MSDFSAKDIPSILFVVFQELVDMVADDEPIFPESATTEDKECLLLYFSSLFTLHDKTHDKKFSTETISDAIQYFYFDAIDDGLYTKYYAQKRYDESYDLFEKFFQMNIEYICHSKNGNDLMHYISNIVSKIPSCERYNAIGNASLAVMIPHFLDVIDRAYDMVISILEKNDEQSEIPKTAPEGSQEPPENIAESIPEVGQQAHPEILANETKPQNHVTQEPFQKKEDWKNRKSSLILLIFALAISLIASIYFYSEYTEAKADVESLEHDATYWEDRANYAEQNYKNLSTKYKNMENQYYFYENHACIVTESGYRYHRYGCPHLNYDSFWIYNTENAKYHGYTPCKDCNPPQ